MTDKLPAITGFPPIVSDNARVLILGTMPGVESLRQQQYYAHPRNAFWPIMATLLGYNLTTDYSQRKQYLLSNDIALWDVLQSCFRLGSLDAAIEQSTIIVNDFSAFFSAHPKLSVVYFNGGGAEKLFQRYVLKELSGQFPELIYQRLPSTSPAYAALSFSDKLAAWQAITVGKGDL